MREKFAEMEETKANEMKWTPLPPPKVERYLRKPVVLLNWKDELDSTEVTDDHSKCKEYSIPDYDVIDVIVTDDDESFGDISQLTAKLEDMEREAYFTDSLDEKPTGETSEGDVSEGGDDHIPPAPKFGSDDDDDYGNDSDMDLFESEDLERLFDDVEQHLQQGAAGHRGRDGEREFDSFDFSPPARVEVGGHVSSKMEPFKSSTSTGQTCRSAPQSKSTDVKPIFQYPTIHRGGSETRIRRECGPSTVPQSSTETASRVTHYQSKITNSSGSYFDINQPHERTPQQQGAQRERSSSSSDSKLSPDSDDLPPVDWGRGSRPAVASRSKAISFTSTTTVKDEQRARAGCSKDILQESLPRPSMLAETCPICNFSFPTG